MNRPTPSTRGQQGGEYDSEMATGEVNNIDCLITVAPVKRWGILGQT